jgi:hypothetical protein
MPPPLAATVDGILTFFETRFVCAWEMTFSDLDFEDVDKHAIACHSTPTASALGSPSPFFREDEERAFIIFHYLSLLILSASLAPKS